MPAALTLFDAALQWLGELDFGEAPNSSEALAGLQYLNRIVDLWSAMESMATSAVLDGAVVLPGTNSVVLAQRYVKIVSASAVTANTPMFPLKILTAVEWNQIPDKLSQSNMTEGFFYDRGAATPKAYIAPAASGLNIVLQWEAWAAQAQFPDPTTVVALLPGYEKALITALAIDLAPNYEVEPSPALLAANAQAMGEIQKLNESLWRASESPAEPEVAAHG